LSSCALKQTIPSFIHSNISSSKSLPIMNITFLSILQRYLVVSKRMISSIRDVL
jgi:hypothetical protein